VYWQKIQATLVGLASQRQAQRFALNIIIGFLPAAIIGLLAYKAIKAHLFTPGVVAGAFIVGALIILWVEKAQPVKVRIESVDDMSPLDALKVGFAQCFGMIPGTSRSGATIIGGMLFGLSRKAATEFSFFLAIPTLVGAGVYSLYKERALLSMADLPLFTVGFVLSFISAWMCVRWLLRYISTHSFAPFAWYRIVFGIVVLATAWSGLVTWSA
jgi:undecaprenyl-diphosphatase